MIAQLDFESPDATGIRRAKFVPRASIPLGAACVVANGVRETLRELFGERCELNIGEPAAIERSAWDQLARDAYCFVTCGRQTDIVLVLPAADARVLVQRAFGEAELLGAPELSALELHALERIAARCAGTFDPLYAERRGLCRRLAAADVPSCVGYFDIHVVSPIRVDLGIGVVRDLPDAGPTGAFPEALLHGVPLEVRVEFATGTLDARRLLGLAVGDTVPFATQVGSPAALKIGHQRLASGAGGITGARYSFEVHSVDGTGARS